MFKKYKLFSKITRLGGIARRYFVNNFYDGLLTVLGILLGFFVLILEESHPFIESEIVLLTGFGTAISMLISGISGSYMSEKAEQRKLKLELDKAMVVVSEAVEEDSNITKKELEKAMLKRIKLNDIVQNEVENEGESKRKTLQEKAKTFATISVALVNGIAPFLGGIIPLIPFFLVSQAIFETFMISFLIIFISIVLLGVFLGAISRESIIKNILQLLIAFTLTIAFSIIILRIS
ncbi:MAG: VIT1/CCC1 transporter family protein [Candidatus Hermodarchaeota archaeon]